MRYLIDTNVVSEIRKGKRADPSVMRWLSGVADSELFISVLVVGELRQGIERLRRRDPDRAAVFERWLRELREHYGDRILEVALEDAELWGHLNAGNLLPTVGSLMAAQARRREMAVVSANVRDFQRISVEVLNPFEYSGR